MPRVDCIIGYLWIKHALKTLLNSYMVCFRYINNSMVSGKPLNWEDVIVPQVAVASIILTVAMLDRTRTGKYSGSWLNRIQLFDGY